MHWVQGYFPESAANVDIPAISFAHIDLDIYEIDSQHFELFET